MQCAFKKNFPFLYVHQKKVLAHYALGYSDKYPSLDDSENPKVTPLQPLSQKTFFLKVCWPQTGSVKFMPMANNKSQEQGRHQRLE